jgi:hypothetical protein
MGNWVRRMADWKETGKGTRRDKRSDGKYNGLAAAVGVQSCRK